MITSPTLSPLDYQLQLPNQWKILAIYAFTLLMYTVAGPDPDPNPRGGSELPNPNEWNQEYFSLPLWMLMIGVTGYELSLCVPSLEKKPKPASLAPEFKESKMYVTFAHLQTNLKPLHFL